MNTSIKIKDVAAYLESQAPRSYEEPYDNTGLLTGDPLTEVKGILVTVDCMEEVVDEAIRLNCNLIVTHHPIVFKGLKKFTGSNYVERVVVKAIKNDIGIYAIHTNLDNVHNGVNRKICERIGLKNLKILSPKKGILSALHDAGAGQIGHYKNCSFRTEGIGSFMPDEASNPHIGKAHSQENVQEYRVEVIFPAHAESNVLSALKKAHPYEEIAYYVSALDNENQEVGAGMVGELESPKEPLEFLKGLKVSMELEVIRHTKILNNPVKKVAVCGGSGSFLLDKAVQSGAQVFITADFKYHDFFDADGRIIVADIGHYESEAFTKELLMGVLIKKFPTFAIIFSKTVTNPISYL